MEIGKGYFSLDGAISSLEGTCLSPTGYAPQGGAGHLPYRGTPDAGVVPGSTMFNSFLGSFILFSLSSPCLRFDYYDDDYDYGDDDGDGEVVSTGGRGRRRNRNRNNDADDNNKIEVDTSNTNSR